MKFYGKDKKEYNSLLESIFKKSFHEDDYELIDVSTCENESEEDHEFIIKINTKENVVNIDHDSKLIISQNVTSMKTLNVYKDDNELIKNIIHILESMLTYDNDYIDEDSTSYSCKCGKHVISEPEYRTKLDSIGEFTCDECGRSFINQHD